MSCIGKRWTRNTSNPYDFTDLDGNPAKGVGVHIIFAWPTAETEDGHLLDADSRSYVVYYDSHGREDHIKDACPPITFLLLKDLECGSCTIGNLQQCFQTVPPGAVVTLHEPQIIACCPD